MPDQKINEVVAKARLQFGKKIEVSLPACQAVSKMSFSPRIENGHIVFEIRMPDGSRVCFSPNPNSRVLTPVSDQA